VDLVSFNVPIKPQSAILLFFSCSEPGLDKFFKYNSIIRKGSIVYDIYLHVQVFPEILELLLIQTYFLGTEGWFLDDRGEGREGRLI